VGSPPCLSSEPTWLPALPSASLFPLRTHLHAPYSLLPLVWEDSSKCACELCLLPCDMACRMPCLPAAWNNFCRHFSPWSGQTLFCCLPISRGLSWAAAAASKYRRSGVRRHGENSGIIAWRKKRHGGINNGIISAYCCVLYRDLGDALLRASCCRCCARTARASLRHQQRRAIAWHHHQVLAHHRSRCL